MQFNIHVPKDREALIAKLDARAAATGDTKSQIVLDALAAVLNDNPDRKPRLRVASLGVTEFSRADIYDRTLEKKLRAD